MLPANETQAVTRRRALLTDRERELLKDADAGSQRYVAVSRVRTKIQEELGDDVEIIKENHSDLYDELRDVVCKETRDAREGEPEPDVSPTPATEPGVRAPPSREPPTELPDLDDIDAEVWEAVDDVTADWDDDERLQNRRAAAASVLQYAVEHGENIGKSHKIVGEAREQYPVEGQKPETYWIQNIRRVLTEVGEYSSGTHSYAVKSLDTGENND